jgi:lipoyl(octanoyl) transferase
VSSAEAAEEGPGSALVARNLGRVAYREAWALMRSLHLARQQGRVEDTLLLVEHPAVITVTRRGGRAHVLATDEEARRCGVEVVETDRGGDVTAHAPGQVVAYPIIKLVAQERDLPGYVGNLEAAVVDVLEAYGLTGTRLAGEPGVFLPPVGEGGRWEKVAALGVKGTRFVMMHGLALNVETDLTVFDLIVPCGLRHRGVTSMRARLGPRTPGVGEVADLLAVRLAVRLGRRLVVGEGGLGPAA